MEFTESELRAAIVQYGRLCYDRRLMTSNDGNISSRCGQDRLLITPAGIAKGRLQTSQLVLVDHEGRILEAPAEMRPSSELAMHLEVYSARPDARAVIHAHPVFATALTVAGLPFPSDILPEVLMTLGDVPVTEYAMPSSAEDAEAIAPFIVDHDAVLLRQHGALALGETLEQALLHLERIEHAAEIFWRAHQLGHVEHLSREVRDQLISRRKGNTRA